MPTQPDLVLRARDGDHEAFTALAAGALSRLHRAARLILRDDERASDAVQEALTLFETVGPDYARYVRWSPDGRSLVLGMARYPDTKVTTSTVIGEAIAVVDLSAAKPAARFITDWTMFVTYPDWSWATDRIVFSTFDLGFRDFGAFKDTTPPSDLYTIEPDGTDLKQLTHNASGPATVRNGTASGPLSTQPSWTPDGSSIIFVQVEGTTWPGWGMATVAADGTGLAPAAGSDYLLGTHPRSRPLP